MVCWPAYKLYGKESLLILLGTYQVIIRLGVLLPLVTSDNKYCIITLFFPLYDKTNYYDSQCTCILYAVYNIIGISFIGVVCCNHKMSGGYFKYILPSTQGVGGGSWLLI